MPANDASACSPALDSGRGFGSFDLTAELGAELVRVAELWREHEVQGDLGAFLNALCEGRLLRRETLLRLWKPYRYRGGGAGWSASGWEYGTSDRYKHVGHDGGTKVRARLLFGDSLSKDTYAVIYLTNGSATNVWSSTLIDSLVAITSRYESASP